MTRKVVRKGERRSAAAAETLKRLHADPEFAAERDRRARERFLANQPELQRKARAARRGVDVPPELEAEWKRLTNRRRKGALTAAEAAKALGLKYQPKRKPHGTAAKPRRPSAKR